MATWNESLGIEESRIRILYQLLHGFITDDLRHLHIPGDVRTNMKLELEIKGWNRNNWLPLETWSVLEQYVQGWAWKSGKVKVWFIRQETQEALGISMDVINKFLIDTKLSELEIYTCNCGKEFEIHSHEHPCIVRQSIQNTDRHTYHSACLFVKPDAFPYTYLGNQNKKPESRLL